MDFELNVLSYPTLSGTIYQSFCMAVHTMWNWMTISTPIDYHHRSCMAKQREFQVGLY